MSGDPLRDAFRAELETVRVAASIPWEIKETRNTGSDQPPIDAGTSYITMRYGGGFEQAAWFASTGNNGWKEHGVVYVNFIAAAGTGTEDAERYAHLIREGFRNRRFSTAQGRGVRILAVNPADGGEDEGVGWRESVAVEYRVFNIG